MIWQESLAGMFRPLKVSEVTGLQNFFLSACSNLVFSLTEINLYRNMDVDHPMIEFEVGNSPKMDFNFSLEDVPMLDDLAPPLSPAVYQSDADIQHSTQTPKKRKVCAGFNYR